MNLQSGQFLFAAVFGALLGGGLGATAMRIGALQGIGKGRWQILAFALVVLGAIRALMSLLSDGTIAGLNAWSAVGLVAMGVAMLVAIRYVWRP